MGKHPLEVVVEPGSAVATMRRTFDAPRALVYDAFTKPELVTKWKTPRSFEVVACELEARAGTKWMIKYKMPNGGEFGLSGEVLEAERPTRFKRTVSFEGKPGKVVETYAFEESGGKTTVTTEMLYDSVEAREQLFNQGQSWGMEAAYEVLDALLLQHAA